MYWVVHARLDINMADASNGNLSGGAIKNLMIFTKLSGMQPLHEELLRRIL